MALGERSGYAIQSENNGSWRAQRWDSGYAINSKSESKRAKGEKNSS
jgi:hypothetical protein